MRTAVIFVAIAPVGLALLIALALIESIGLQIPRVRERGRGAGPTHAPWSGAVAFLVYWRAALRPLVIAFALGFVCVSVIGAAGVVAP